MYVNTNYIYMHIYIYIYISALKWMLKCKFLSLSRQDLLKRSWQKSLLKRHRCGWLTHVFTTCFCPASMSICSLTIKVYVNVSQLPASKSKDTVLGWLIWAACAFVNNPLPHLWRHVIQLKIISGCDNAFLLSSDLVFRKSNEERFHPFK